MILELTGVGVAAFMVSLLVCRVMMALGPRDVPSEARKAHTIATPTSGGVGIGAGYAAGMALALFVSVVWRGATPPEGVALVWLAALFAFPLLLIGFIDDTRHLDAKFKFVMYALICLAASWTVGGVQAFQIGGAAVQLPYIIGLAGAALWMFTMVNAVNFMDGANGLAMGSVAVGLVALTGIALERGSPGGAAVALCGAAALVGFLIWNFPSGRLFAGDSGALFAGAIAAFASLIVIVRTGLSPFVPPLLFFPLLADVLLTLLFRARQGQPLFVAHTHHIYQRAMAAWRSHAPVSLAYWAATVACGGVAFVVARDATGIAPAVALGVLAVLSVAVDFGVRRLTRAQV